MHCLSGIVAHLKSVQGCHHAIKDFDRELECKVECCAKAAGVEAVICCRYARALRLQHECNTVLHPIAHEASAVLDAAWV